MTSTVVGLALRPIGFDTFADLTPLALLDKRPAGRGRVQLVFDGDLTEAESRAVWARMTSRDDDDQAARTALRSADGAANLAEMVRAYVLGDPMPEPVYSTTASTSSTPTPSFRAAVNLTHKPR